MDHFPTARRTALAAVLATATLWGAQSHADGNDGPYAIGHATRVLIDATRNPDGSMPVTGAGRPLYLHLWYPTLQPGASPIRYTWNNPVYNQNTGGTVYPGLPETPALTFSGALSSHPVTDAAPLAPGRFPLLVATHGYEVSAQKNMPDTLESLASHGYIVASVEHTGDDDAWYQTYFLENYVGLALGPNPSIYAATIADRVRDVSFVIDEMLAGKADRPVARFSAQIDADAIGELGYSLGGQTTLATVTGIHSQGLAADRRVKAAFMGAGSNYGLLLDATDYANAQVPLMFLGNDTGIAYTNFNQFTGAPHKVLVDVAGWNHHVGGYQTSWCQDIHHSLVSINPAVFPGAFSDPTAYAPSDIANFAFVSTFYWDYTGPYELGVYNFCDSSVFSGVSDAQLEAVLYGDPTILTARDGLVGAMPLERELPISETTRILTRYAQEFFDESLRHERPASASQPDAISPAVRVTRDCQSVPARPFDLGAGDEIRFVPSGDAYRVSVRSGVSVIPVGSPPLRISGNSTVPYTYPGFSFPVPGFATPVSTLFISEDGAITSRTSGDYASVDDNGSPWYTRGQLLLTNRLTIAALMKDLDAAAAAASGGGVFIDYDATGPRIIVTYLNIPSAGTTDPNTIQVLINASGEIDLVIGALANTGPAYAPEILGTIGIAAGTTRAADLQRTQPTDFGALRGAAPVTRRFADGGAIYVQYEQGIAASCNN